MIKTTRIKYSQAPRIIVDDLSPQCDGVKQTFTLSRPVPEWAPYCLVFNGQLYTNTSYKQWFVLDADRKTIHTSFITPPTQGPNKSLILIVGVAGMEDLGVTWDDIVNKPEIPTEEVVDAKDAAVLEDAKEYADSIVPTVDVTKAYVDQQDADTLADAKAYADSIIPTVDVTKAYVDQQDADTLEEAKAYTDTHSGDKVMYVDLTINEFGTSTVYTTANKTVTEVLDAITNNKVVLYRVVLPQSIPSLSLDAGTYLFRPDYAGTTMVVATPTSWTEVPLAVGLTHEAPTDVVIQFTQVSSVVEEVATPIVNSAISQANIPVVTLSNTDITEGSALPANNFYGVYIEGSE